MRSSLWGVVVLVLCVFVPGPPSALAQDPVPAALVVDSGNRFGMDLYAQLRGRSGNLFFSPYSISSALTMVYAGAKGNTAMEMARVLYIAIEGEAWHKAFSEHMKALNAPQGCELTLVHSLWGQTGYAFSPAYLSLIGNYYGGELEQVDFTQASVAADSINAWVKDKTHEKIREIVSPDALGVLTRLVLVNAVYFKGKWQMPFNAAHTEDRPFYVAVSDQRAVPMMNQRGHFFYMENEQVQVLELMYESKEFSMVIVLPRKADGLSEAEAAFDVEHYNDWTSRLSARDVDVTLPKFKDTQELGLVKTLMALGIKDVFAGAADLSGMSVERGLQVSDVIHKAFVDVTEEGTEAAAATAVETTKQLLYEEPSTTAVPFVADHPFLYVIRDRRTGSILFMGRMMDPYVGARQVGDVLGGVWDQVVGQALQVQKNINSQAQK